MREWLESKTWYWFTLTFDFTPFPWHWQIEYTNYNGWGKRILFGPIGVMMIWPYQEKENNERRIAASS